MKADGGLGATRCDSLQPSMELCHTAQHSTDDGNVLSGPLNAPVK